MRFAPIAAAFALSASLLAGPAAAAPGGEGKDGQKDWTSHKGDIPFIIGREAGLKEAEFTGKPILYFYTATW